MSEMHFYGRIPTPVQDGVGRALKATYDPATDMTAFIELIEMLDALNEVEVDEFKPR